MNEWWLPPYTAFSSLLRPHGYYTAGTLHKNVSHRKQVNIIFIPIHNIIIYYKYDLTLQQDWPIAGLRDIPLRAFVIFFF